MLSSWIVLLLLAIVGVAEVGRGDGFSVYGIIWEKFTPQWLAIGNMIDGLVGNWWGQRYCCREAIALGL